MSSIMASLKSMVATATLSVIASTAAAQPNADIDSPALDPINFERAYKEASLDRSPIFDGTTFDSTTFGENQQDPFRIPANEDLSMTYNAYPLTVSEGAKRGRYPVFKLEDGSVGVPVMPLSEMSDNTPKEFFDYMKYYFNSGIVEGGAGEKPSAGFAHTHIAIAVDPNNPESVAKIKELNEMLTAKIMGDSKSGVSGWAEKYGEYVDAIVPIYINGNETKIYSDPFFAYQNVSLKDGDMIGVIANHPALLDSNNRPFQSVEDLSLLLGSFLEEGGHVLTRAEYREQNIIVDNYDPTDADMVNPIGFVDPKDVIDDVDAQAGHKIIGTEPTSFDV